MKILKRLSEAMGVSGAETEVRRAILDLIGPHVDDIQTDTLGNVLAFKQGTQPGSMTVLIDAHMDEVGLMVTGYTSDGMLRVKAIGGLDDRILLGTRVLVGPKKIPGVIGGKPVHLLSNSEHDRVVGLDSMRVDIGVSSKETAQNRAPLGTRIGFDTTFMDLGPTVRGKAFDDRVGCAVLVHILRGDRLPVDVVGAFVVQEEVGLRGARVAAHRTNPDCAFVLEGTIADDLPREEDESPTTELHRGPALSPMDNSVIYAPRLNRFLMNTAEELGIPYQFKQPGIGGTDGGAIVTTLAGIPAAAISVPCRYIHSPAAILSKDDYRHAIRLLRAALERMDRGIITRG